MAASTRGKRKAQSQPPRRVGTQRRPDRERFELAMRAINEGVYDWDVAANRIYYSEGVYTVLKMPWSMKTPAGWRTRIHPDDLAAYDAAIVAHFKKKTSSFVCDYRFRARDGAWRWARQRGVAIRDRQGRAVRMVGSIGDITELKRAEIELRQARDEATEALERQTATAEILKVISSSPTDVQPVFDTIAETAMRLFGAWSVGVFRFDGELFHVGAVRGALPDSEEFVRKRFPQRPEPQGVMGRCILECTAQQNSDTWRHPDPRIREIAQVRGHRAILAVPMLSKGKPIGTINITRKEPGAFAEAEVEVLKTFADQAVIAIENVRLFNETKEALERQTATAEILKVIAASPADVQPVFDAIVHSAARLVEPCNSGIVMREGDVLLVRAMAGPRVRETDQEEIDRIFPVPLDPQHSIAARVMAERRVVEILDTEAPGIPEVTRRSGQAMRFRSVTQVPLLREENAIGTIVLTHPEPGFKLTEKQLSLVKTFADQAVIAIENVRLFTELRTSNRELTKALDTQTATGDILRVISRSQTDVQPVFDAIVHSAVRLLRGYSGALSRVIGDEIVLAANTSTDEAGNAATKALFPQPLRSAFPHALAIRAGTPFNVADAWTDGRLLEDARAYAHVRGYRSWIVVPMLRQNGAIGAIGVTRREAGGFTDDEIALLQTFADQAVIAIENVRLFNETKEALERQTATAEILKVISGSPTDVQPVFDAIVASAVRLIGGYTAVVARLVDENLHLAAFISVDKAGDEELKKRFPLPISSSPVIAEAVRAKVPLFVSDTETDARMDSGGRELARARGYRSIVHVPMLREGVVVGTIHVTRVERGGFTDHEVGLLKTFADQAVIAIENVRLFNETKEALERQTATAEILKVISSSPTDVQPVFDAIVASARTLCDAAFSDVVLLEGDQLKLGAAYGLDRKEMARITAIWPRPAGPETVVGRAIVERQLVHVPDLASDPDYAHAPGHVLGIRTILGVPMLREGRPIGAIGVWRCEVKLFTGRQIALLQTFADQAVIAIENVRLFNETKEALEKQTATADILQVLSGSPSDTQPVFAAIVRHAARLCESSYANVFRYDGQQIHLAASQGGSQEVLAALRARFPASPNRKRVVGRVIETGRAVHVEDTFADTEYDQGFAETLKLRRLLGVPLLRGGDTVGAITVGWAEAGPILQRHEDLLKTFADQAVIAIENVRLFKELESRTEALARSVGQLTGLREVGQAIGSSLDLETVLRTIVSRALQLTGLDAGEIFEYDEQAEQFTLRAAENLDEGIVEALRRSPLRKGEGAVGRAGATGEPAEIPEILDASYQSQVRELLVGSGIRALLAVPLLRDEHLLGALVVNRKSPGPFAPEIVDLLWTFATQSAVAIQNARLYREIVEKSRQLEVASRHKSQFLASMSHELRTPLNAILGFNEMMLDDVYGAVPPEMTEPLEETRKSGKHLLRLINNVLDLAKIEAGRMELALGEYAVTDVVEGVRSALRSLAADKGLELVATVAPDIPLAYGDAGRITQCLMNLAGNALKFTKAGRVGISVALRNDTLVYGVSDTGIGIAQDKIPSLFTEFRQTDAAIASEYGGTGLGLAISKKFVEMHRGRIWVESEVGKGSTFAFEVPLRFDAGVRA